jgi:hypothetical protein
MASYIDNINANAAVAAPQAFTPDWSFLGKTQTALTDMQRKGFEDFRSKYSTFLNSELSREDNIALRERFKKQADQTISRITGTDLTDPRNVASAKGIFKPLVENSLYTKDIMTTKALRQEYMKGQSLMNAADERVRAAYNPYSIQEIQYAMQDFQNMDPEAALSFSAPRYINNVDLEGLAQKYYDERGWETVMETYDGSGLYKITTKNGEIIREDVNRYLQSRFANDPLIQANLALKSRVERRNYVEANLDNFGGDRTAATAAYLRTRYDELSTEAQEVLAERNNYIKSLSYAKEEIEESVERNGAPVSEYQQNLYNDLMTKYEAAEEEANTVDGVKPLNLSENPTQAEILGAISMIDQLEFNSEVAVIANSLAYSKAETKIDDSLKKVQLTADLQMRNMYARVQAEHESKVALKMLELEMQGMMQGGIQNTPINIGNSNAIPEGADGVAYVEYNQGTVDNYAIQSRQNGAMAIAQWAALTGTVITDAEGNPIADENIVGLSQDKYNEYLEKARVVSESGTRLKNADGTVNQDALALNATLANYDKSKLVYEEVLKFETENILNALDSYNPGDDEVKQFTLGIIREIVNDGFITPDLIKAEYEKRVNDPTFMDRMNSIPPFGNPFNLLGAIGDYFFDDREDRWEEVMEDKGGVYDMYSRNAKDISGVMMGVDATVGGLSRVGTNLGYASTKGGQVNSVINMALQGVNQDMGTVVIGDIPTTLSENSPASDKGSEILRAITTRLNTSTGKGAPRNMSVSIYRDPSTGKQYLNIIPDPATIKELTGTKANKGVAYGQGEDLALNGITVRLENAGVLPESVYSMTTSNVETYMNLNKGAYTVGGDNPMQGGKIVITKSSTGYDYKGYIWLYKPELNKHIKQPLDAATIKKLKESGDSVDAIVQNLEQQLQTVAISNIKEQN